MFQPLLRSRLKSIALASISLFIAVILLMYPEQAFKSSLRGLTIWWDVVFPALLPFFITAEMMMGFGVVHFLGVLLEPLMRPIFRVPGEGAFVMAVGLISGNPMGAKLTSRLREQRLISREEGERLVSFTSTAGPLFIFGAVSVGFFENVSIGIILALAHYSSSILVGLIMRFYEPHATPSSSMKKKEGWILIRAVRAMHRARLQDGRPLGKLLGESVSSAVQTLLMIGGFIILFSVLVHLINYVGITAPLTSIIAQILDWFHFPVALSDAMLSGIFEITLGSQMASASPDHIPLIYQLTIVSIMIGWNGLSIHAQVASMLSRTDVRYLPYLLARIIHGLLAGVLTLMIYPFFKERVANHPTALPVFSDWTSTSFIRWEGLQSLALVVLFIWMIYTSSQLWKKRASKN